MGRQWGAKASLTHARGFLGNHRYVFTLVHKFQTPDLLCDRSDIIVLTYETHRSQYNTLPLNMRAALIETYNNNGSRSI